MILLADRALVRLHGRDSAKFLQGLISNDINNATNDQWLYALILDHTGRLLYDVFIIKDSEGVFLLDHHADYSEDFIEHMQSLKFRSDILFSRSALRIASIELGNVLKRDFLDPRSAMMGYRCLITNNDDIPTGDLDQYHVRRIRCRIPDIAMDMVRGVSMPLDYGMDRLNAISFTKGCYRGQESISKARNIVGRQRDIFVIEGNNIAPKGSDIVCGEIIVGKTCGSVNNSLGLGLFNLSKLNTASGQLSTYGNTITIK